MPEAGFQTERLDVRPWDRALAKGDSRRALEEALRGLLTPSVLQHLPPALQLGDGAGSVSRWVTERAAESAVLTLRERATSQVIGLLILAEQADLDVDGTAPEAADPAGTAVPVIHLGYLLGEATWGKGYGSELIAGLIGVYARGGRTVQLVGGVDPANPASARILEKNGFTVMRAVPGGGGPRMYQRQVRARRE